MRSLFRSLLVLVGALWVAAAGLCAAGERLRVADHWRGFGEMGLEGTATAHVGNEAGMSVKSPYECELSIVMANRATEWRFVAIDSAGHRLEAGVVGREQKDAFGDARRIGVFDVRLDGEPLEIENCGKATPQPDGSRSALILARRGREWEIRVAGARDGAAARFVVPHFDLRWIGIAPAEAGRSVELERAELREEADRYAELMRPLDADSVADHLLRSADSMEGYWMMLDRTLEETQLRPGGDYRMLALADGNGGYEFLYMAGARVHAPAWRQGMLKMRLIPTPLPGVYDCEWYDAEGLPLKRDVKAQLGVDERTLTVLFPYQNSSLRLIREPRRTPRTK